MCVNGFHLFMVGLQFKVFYIYFESSVSRCNNKTIRAHFDTIGQLRDTLIIVFVSWVFEML